jgi:hypothetical protein
MTTITWDGRTLAGDTQYSMFRGTGSKVFHLKTGALFGSCGQIQDGAAVRDWLENGGEKPKVSEGFHAIMIEGGKLFTLEDRLVKIEHDRPFFAIGSGRDFAMAAMHLSKTAAEAVRVSHAFDPDTGPDLTELSVSDPNPRSLDDIVDQPPCAELLRERLSAAGLMSKGNGSS